MQPNQRYPSSSRRSMRAHNMTVTAVHRRDKKITIKRRSSFTLSLWMEIAKLSLSRLKREATRRKVAATR